MCQDREAIRYRLGHGETLCAASCCLLGRAQQKIHAGGNYTRPIPARFPQVQLHMECIVIATEQRVVFGRLRLAEQQDMLAQVMFNCCACDWIVMCPAPASTQSTQPGSARHGQNLDGYDTRNDVHFTAGW